MKQGFSTRYSGQPRADAARILVEAMSGRSRSTDLLDQALRTYPPGRDRDARLLHELVMGVLRHRLALMAVLEQRVQGGIGRVSPIIREVLLVMAYQALFLERVPAHARVSTAVEAARTLQGEGAARLVNAVGRALEARLRAGDDPLAPLSPPTRWSLPEPVWKRIGMVMGRDLGPDEADRIAGYAPWAFRVNRMWATREEAIARLREAGVEAEPTRFASDGVVISRRGPTRWLDGRGGRVEDWVPRRLIPQDEASQLVVQILNPMPGERIVDVCAGVGVKTADILARAPGARVVAVDLDWVRLKRAQRLCQTMGLGQAAFLCGDARHSGEGLKGWADAVLVDAPCTGIGTLRRRPEVRYVRREEDFARAARTQTEILAIASDLVRPGGRVVYAVCSFAPEEGPDVVASVLASRRDLHIEPIPLSAPFIQRDGTALILPWREAMDGFYVAVLRRA